MKAVKFAGLVLMVLSSASMASTVAWDVYTTNNTTIAAGATTSITIRASVKVLPDNTADNQGLGSFKFNLACWKPGSVGTTLVQLPAAAPAWAPVYSVDTPDPENPGKLGSNKTITTAGVDGGLGMDVLASTGTVDTAKMWVQDVGASMSTYWQEGQAGPLRWDADNTMAVGKAVWGLGLDSQKSRLMASTSKPFDVVTWKISVTTAGTGTWAPGTYTVQLVAGDVSVLTAGLDLNTFQPGSVITPAVATGDTLTFTVLPEPTTLLLLAGAGLFYRRRHA